QSWDEETAVRMNGTLVRYLLRAYPSAWRQRYGEEFEDILLADHCGPRTVLDVLRSALRERWSPQAHTALPMNADSGSVPSRLARAMTRALGLLLGSSLGYGFAACWLFTAFAKPFHPARVGLWLLPNPH